MAAPEGEKCCKSHNQQLLRGEKRCGGGVAHHLKGIYRMAATSSLALICALLRGTARDSWYCVREGCLRSVGSSAAARPSSRIKRAHAAGVGSAQRVKAIGRLEACLLFTDSTRRSDGHVREIIMASAAK